MDQEETYNLQIVNEYDLEDELILLSYKMCTDTAVHNGITNDCFDKRKT